MTNHLHVPSYWSRCEICGQEGVYHAGGERSHRFTAEQLNKAVEAGARVGRDGELELDVPRILRALGIEPTQEAIDNAAELLAGAAADQLPPGSQVIIQP